MYAQCLIIIALLLAIINSTYAQTQMRFEHLSLEHGLPQSSAIALLQDTKGFLWVGTQDGLARYDGYNFTVYRKHLREPHALKGDWVQTLYEDSDGMFWIGTLDGGLQQFNPYTQQFTSYPYKMPENPRATIAVRTIFDDSKSHSLWLGTNGSGILVFDKKTKSFSQAYRADKNNTQSLSGNAIRDFFCDRRGKLWIATNNGLCSFDRTTKTFHSICQPSITKTDTKCLNISQLCEISPDTLLVGTMEGEVFRFDCSREQFLPFPASERLAPYLGGSMISDILPDAKGTIWFASGGNGLVLLEKNGNVTHHLSKTYFAQSLSSNMLRSLYQDCSGIMWIGTNDGGLNKFDPKAQNFTLYQHNDALPESLTADNISVMITDHLGVVWIGTEYGLNALNPKTNTLQIYRHNANKRGTISNNTILSLAEDSLGTLWVATMKGGLDRFDRTTGRFSSYVSDDKRWKNNPIASWASMLYVDRRGMLWMQGAKAAYQCIDPKTLTVSAYKHADYLGRRVPKAYVEDTSNVWWIGSFGEGLTRFDSTTRQYERFTNDSANIHTIASDIVEVLRKDSRGWLWVGTSQGVDLFDHSSKTFTHIREKGNISIGIVNAILEDNQGRIWFSDNHGLAVITILNTTISHTKDIQYSVQRFDIGDGLQSNEFNANAACKGLDGRLYFGGVKGVCAFHPDSITRNTKAPLVVFTNFKSSNINRVFDTSASEAKTLRLNSSENSFTISFAALDFANPQKNLYAYRLEGFDKGWIYTSAQERTARYTNLDYGAYIFHVIAANNHGVWNKNGIRLPIVIQPPFWRTIWFYAFVVVIAIFITWTLYQWKLRNALRRADEVEKMKEIQSNIIRKRAADDFHDEFGHKLTKIALLSEVMKRNASSTTSEVNAGEMFRQQNLTTLTKIIDTATELSIGMRDFLWTLNPEKDSLYEIAIRLKDFGEDFFDKTDIAFHALGITDELEFIRVSMDERRHITLLFKEAMNNILKHSNCQNVLFEVAFLNGEMSIMLSDDGKGIASNDALTNGLERHSTTVNGFASTKQVNDTAPQVLTTNTLSHNHGAQGLFSMQERAERARGELKIISQQGQGTTVHFSKK